MNLSDFRTRVARVTGLSPTQAEDLALIDGWVNEGVEQFLRETKLNVRMAAMSLTAGQQDYTLDDDILAVQALWYEPAEGTRGPIMEQIAPEDMAHIRLPESTAWGTTRYYSLVGAHTLMLHPTVGNEFDVIHLLYVPRPAAMSATSDTPAATANGNIPLEYHTLIEAYAKWKGAEAEEHKGSDNGLQFQAEWERGIGKVKGDLKRKAGVVNPSVRLGRPRRYMGSPGVDMGY